MSGTDASNEAVGRSTDRRKLVAVMHADMVGYSRLIGLDDTGTLQRLRALRTNLIDPAIAEHGGRLVNTGGDSLLVVFDSVDGAVRCAVKLQQRVPILDAEQPPDRAIRFRVGINLGDAIPDGTDLHGDAINVAARLQAECPPGGICVSRSVRDHVQGRLGLEFDELGPLHLKNIARPVEAYLLRPTATRKSVEPALIHLAGEALPLPDKPSIAVLPFANLSADPEQEYFSDGVADDIITDLSRSRALFVISRNSSFTYRSDAVDVRRVARELGVRYVVAGSVRKVTDNLRVTAQLVDAVVGNQIWAERYDRKITDVFAVQDEITACVSAAIRPMIEHSERERVARKPVLSLSAWECYHRGMWHYTNVELSELERAIGFYRHAVQGNPSFAQAYAALAGAYARKASYYRPEMRGEIVPCALTYAQRAVAIDPTEAMGHAVLGNVLMMSGRHAEGRYEADLAVSLDPNSSYAYSVQGFVRAWGGRPREALGSMDTAIRLSPFDPRMPAFLHVRARAYYLARNYEAAIATARRLTGVAPNYPQAYATLIAALGQTGRTDEARAVLREALDHIGQGFSFFLSLPLDKVLELRPEDREHLHSGFQKAGVHLN